MTRTEQIEELLLRWDELREQGQPVSVDELCRDFPDLVEEVRRQTQALEAMYRVPNGLNANATTRSYELAEPTPATALPELPGYEVLGVLGRGGMGMVYKARHLRLKRLVAVKMILGGAHAGPGERARLRTEAEAIARLHHPHIVQIYEVGEHAGVPFLALEFVEGGSLADQLKGKPQPAGEAARLVEALARAMHYAHEQGIVHRDLKPANILLAFGREPPASAGAALAGSSGRNEMTPKITDFGLAKQLDATLGLTQSGAVIGTPSYMAPEQAAGNVRSIGPQTDVYALGAVLYELLTGRPPFQGATYVDTLEQVRSEEPQPPSALRPGVPRDLDTICLKCLEKEPRHRYASAVELAEDLRRYRDGELIHARAFTLVDRVARTLSRDHQVVQFHALGKWMLWLAPVPVLFHGLAFLLIRHGWPHITALWITFASIAILISIHVGVSFFHNLLPRAASLREFWALRIGHWLGLALLPFLCALLATPGQPWEPLTAYPLWALISGVAVFSMGSSFWGPLYAVGLGLFALAFVMALQLEWAVLGLGAAMSAVFTSIAVHLRRMSRASEALPGSFG